MKTLVYGYLVEFSDAAEIIDYCEVACGDFSGRAEILSALAAGDNAALVAAAEEARRNGGSFVTDCMDALLALVQTDRLPARLKAACDSGKGVSVFSDFAGKTVVQLDAGDEYELSAAQHNLLMEEIWGDDQLGPPAEDLTGGPAEDMTGGHS